MPLKIGCPSCGKQLTVPDSAAGKSVKCPGCNTVFNARPPARPAVVRAIPADTNPRKPAPKKPSREVEAFDDEDDRPRSRQRQGGGALLWVVFGLVFLLLFLGGGLGAVVVLRPDLIGMHPVVAVHEFTAQERPEPTQPDQGPAKTEPEKKTDPEKKPDPVKPPPPPKDGGPKDPLEKFPDLPGEKPEKDGGPAPQAVLKGDPSNNNRIVSLAYSSDGKRLIVGYRSGLVKEWDPATQQSKDILQLSEENKQGLDTLALSPDGKTLAVLGKAGPRLLDAETGKEKAALDKPPPILLGGNILRFSPDGKYLAAVVLQALKVYEADTGKQVAGLDGPFHGTEGVAFTPDSKTLVVSGMLEEQLIFWDLGSRKQTDTLKVSHTADKKANKAIALSPDGKFLAAGTNESIRLWDLTTKRQRTPLVTLGNPGYEGVATLASPATLAFSSDGKMLAAGYFDGGGRLWDVASGKLLVTVNRRHNLTRPTALLSPDNKQLVLEVGVDVRAWDIAKLPLAKVEPSDIVADEARAVPSEAHKQVPVLAGQLDPFLGGGFDLQTKSILTAQADGTLKCYSHPDLKVKATAKLPGTAYRAVLDPKGKLLYAMVTTKPKQAKDRFFGPGDLHVYDVSDLLNGKAAEGAALAPKMTLALGTIVSRLLLSPDGSALFCLDSQDEKNVKVIRVDAAKMAKTAEAPLGNKTKTLWLTRDGKTLYTSGEAGPPPAPPGVKPTGMFGSVVQGLDPATLKVTRSVPIDSQLPPPVLVATDDGLVYTFRPGMQSTNMAVLDMKRAYPPAGDWWLSMVGLGLSQLQLSQDQRHLYLTSEWGGFSFNRPHLVSWNVLDDLDKPGTPAHEEVGGPVRKVDPKEKVEGTGTVGESLVSPDGKYLLIDGGALFELKDGGAAPVVSVPKPGDNPKPPDPPKPGDPPRPVETPKPGAHVSESLELHAQVPRYYGGAVDPKAKAAVLTFSNSTIAVYGYPDFKSQTTYKVAGIAYRPALDPDQGLLYALVPGARLKTPAHVKRGGSNEIQVFEIKPALEGKLKSNTELKPARTFTLETGFITHLSLSPDGKWLYCLDVGDEKSPKVVKLDTADGKPAGEATLKEGTDVLCMSHDGKSLVSIWHTGQHLTSRNGPYEGGVEWVETDGMKVKRSAALTVDPYEVDVTDDGIAFVTGGSGRTSEITILDLKQKGDPVVATWKNQPVGLTVRLSDDGRQLYTSNLRTAPMAITTIPLPDKLAGSEMPKGSTYQVPRLPAAGIRGEMLVTPDAKYLLSESGYILFLKDGDRR